MRKRNYVIIEPYTRICLIGGRVDKYLTGFFVNVIYSVTFTKHVPLYFTRACARETYATYLLRRLNRSYYTDFRATGNPTGSRVSGPNGFRTVSITSSFRLSRPAQT